MKPNIQISGLWVPLVTPFNEGRFDKESLVKLINNVEPWVDGVVPCLSSGEGGKMSDELWAEVVKCVVENTNKPVASGILNPSLEKIGELSQKAKEIGCMAVAIPLQGETGEIQRNFCKEISDQTSLPIILYNTEKIHIDNLKDLRELEQYSNIISLKDSSQNQSFFDEAVKAKKNGETHLSILQGMENQLLESVGCDGYLISLANIEPKLCKDMFLNPSNELNSEVMKRWDEFNLASETWYVGVKEALASRGIIRSAELIK